MMGTKERHFAPPFGLFLVADSYFFGICVCFQREYISHTDQLYTRLFQQFDLLGDHKGRHTGL
jgi:hypothetical protein